MNIKDLINLSGTAQVLSVYKKQATTNTYLGGVIYEYEVVNRITASVQSDTLAGYTQSQTNEEQGSIVLYDYKVFSEIIPLEIQDVVKLEDGFYYEVEKIDILKNKVLIPHMIFKINKLKEQEINIKV